ncbi:s-adenosylmethionine-dependent methyltransferase-like protein [Stemphylium lycopersici]|uniref:protein-histidine N-methyltransferase n=1 Tax=Stemphylium lycopersici TaxID=183478 RepID=A0A364MRR9_STELY|nr:s-adenosylmethionine-dependent methyltransferase-like protein [Stemphylium lycopersici]
MAFSFGFSGDDIEEDPNDVQEQSQQQQQQAGGEESNAVPPPIPAKTHDLDELLSTLPSKISFSTLPLTSPAGHTTYLPRRALFDVRLQLMAEDDLSPSHTCTSNPLSGLSDTDLQTNIYEGGYKTWECSLDLARYLLDRGPRKDLDDMARVDHVIEMGCGSALPTLVLWMYAIRERLGCYFTLTDYNEAVLRCVTLPNLLLAWVSCLGPEESAALFPDEGGNPLLPSRAAAPTTHEHGGVDAGAEEEENADLYITPALVSAFKAFLASTGISLTLVSGSWSPASDLLPLIPSAPDLNTFILGSETIYSPASLTAFADAIVALMGRVKMGKTLVAAKRVYFGVGGSVDGFRLECSQRGCVASEIEFEGLGDGSDGGVRRCLVEVQMY